MPLQPVQYALGVVFVAAVGHPLAVLLHELGHAVVPLARSEADVEIRIGATPRWEFSVGRLRVRASVAGYSPVTGLPGFVRYRHESLGRRARVVSILGGPAVTLALLTATLVAVPDLAGVARFGAVLLAYTLGFQLLTTLLPVEYPDWWGAYGGVRSDGRRAIDALRDGR